MPTLNDARFVALRGQGFTGATNDMLLEWLQGQLPLANLLTNPELAGGAASGPVDGNNPPTGWTRPFNTVDSAPVDIGGGFFEWEMNLAQDDGRCAISRDLADDLGGEVAGTKILFTVECSNPTLRNYSAALIASTFAGATVTGTVARVRPFSTETLALEFTIDDPATLRAEIRMGVGTTANNTVGLILRNPALYRSTDARTPRNSLPDAWSTFLAQQLGSAATGQRNDDWYAYLGSLGYEGQLNDRELQFWTDGGVVSQDGVRITQQPVRYSGLENSNATFTVVATSGNASTLFYQWQELISGAWEDLVNAGQISGATTATLTVSAIQVPDQGRRFRVRVTNSYNSINSQSADIWVSGATWFIIDEVTGDRMVTETLLDEIVDERSP